MSTEPSPDPHCVVMKFGGSSVADLDAVRRVASFVVQRAADQRVVVVVSAMGKSTDRLVHGARELCSPPAARELDMLLTTGERHSMAMLALAIEGMGRRAISLTGSQCGIITDHRHGQARIVEVRPFRIQDELAADHVVIVGGFQGVSYKREVTTLGRGGSDTTAVALAAALGADCEIYSDVDGVYDADPRIVEDAERIEQVSYGEMEALSRAGARVLHARAVELAAAADVVIYARKTGDQGAGQSVVRRDPIDDRGVRAVAGDEVARFEVAFAPALSPTHVAALSRAVGNCGLHRVHVDERGAVASMSLRARDDVDAVERRLGEALASLAESGAAPASVRRLTHGRVALVGAGLEERSELLDEANVVLEGCGATLLGVDSDAHTLGLFVASADLDLATRALHAHFVAKDARTASNGPPTE